MTSVDTALDPTRERLTILANSDVSRGKYAAAAVHAALFHFGIDHGAVVVLGERGKGIEEQCDLVIHDAGRTEVKPGTPTAGVPREQGERHEGES